MSRNFNPRSREGSDKPGRGLFIISSYFNPRSREGSDYGRVDLAKAIHVFQSTLPRRERQNPAYEDLIFQGISIHAPAKGATLRYKGRNGMCALFQSTLPRRERLLPNEYSGRIRKFQSTLPRRERPESEQYLRDAIDISIHAPAKGATRRIFSKSVLLRISIHAPAKGATRMYATEGAKKMQFQSTLPRRERQKCDVML